MSVKQGFEAARAGSRGRKGRPSGMDRLESVKIPPRLLAVLNELAEPLDLPEAVLASQLLQRIDLFLAAKDTPPGGAEAFGIELVQGYARLRAPVQAAVPVAPVAPEPTREAPPPAPRAPSPSAALLQRGKGKSGYEGVYPNGSKGFIVKVPKAKDDPVLTYLGAYANAEDAAWARWHYFKREGIPYGQVAEEVAEMRRIHPTLDDEQLLKLAIYNRELMPGTFGPLIDQDGWQLTCDYGTKGFDAPIVRFRTPLVDLPPLEPEAAFAPTKRKPGRPRKDEGTVA